MIWSGHVIGTHVLGIHDYGPNRVVASNGSRQWGVQPPTGG